MQHCELTLQSEHLIHQAARTLTCRGRQHVGIKMKYRHCRKGGAFEPKHETIHRMISVTVQDDNIFSPRGGGGFGSSGYGFAGGAIGLHGLPPPPGRASLAQHPAALPGTAAHHQVGLRVLTALRFEFTIEYKTILQAPGSGAWIGSSAVGGQQAATARSHDFAQRTSFGSRPQEQLLARMEAGSGSGPFQQPPGILSPLASL